MNKQEALDKITDNKPVAVADVLWRPEEGERYWYVGSNGEVFHSIWLNDQIDFVRYDFSSIHKTIEQAKQALKKQLAKMRILRRIAELNDGWVPDWGDRDQRKYLIGRCNLVRGDQTVYWFCSIKDYDDGFYMKTLEMRDMVLEELRDDYKTMWGIE